MATVGHALVGLSLAGLDQTKSRKPAVQYVWPGFVVLFAYLVDLVEWITWICFPAAADNHLLTNSPLLTSGLVILIWIAMALSGWFRGVWPYVIAALAVFSHLVLDQRIIRALVGDAYGYSMGEYLPGFFESIRAEFWLYGFVLVAAALLKASTQANCPRKSRAAASFLAILSIITAATRMAVLWIPAYLLSLTHAALLLRREIRWGLLWNLVPLLPLMVFLAIELTAAWLSFQARELAWQGDVHEAIQIRHRVMKLPTRSLHVENYIGLSKCYQALGDPEKAEAALLKAQAIANGSFGPSYYLAVFYADFRWRNTPFFRPDEAASLLQAIRDGPYTQRIQELARRVLADMQKKGLID